MYEPLVSIIMPLYNCEAYVEESVESVRQQTYKNWELIIVDDASTDKSVDIVKRIMEDESRIDFICLSMNGGVANARNIAIKEAKGKFIAFLDSDDLWLATKLEKQIAMMHRDNIFLSYAAYFTIDERSNVQKCFNVSQTVTYSDMLKTSSIGTLTMMYNAEKFGKYYFNNIGHEDYVMKLTLLKRIEFAKGITEPLAKYRIVGNSLSRNKLKTALWQWRIYRDVEKLSFFKSLYYFTQYSYHGLRKYK